ncbi:MAG TPA: hypothetical protein VGQ99_13235 [Tepidisphaeraceae bacterium]|jgi:hypothetical protein|nr:hypothetical protein [Tepidisphaeraceae bacterium]
MSIEARAIIRWIPESRGGRKHVPNSSVGYSTLALFESDPRQTLGAWSVRIVEAVKLRGSDVVDAKINFLFSDAPAQLLQEGERFRLMEGHKVAAKGVLIGSSIALPFDITDFDVALLG